MNFVNREDELARLEAWWKAEGAQIGMVWGRRRVGKTALIEKFAEGRPTIFHALAGRPPKDELRLLSHRAETVVRDPRRDLSERPFRDWDEAFELLGRATETTPMLLVLDEFPEALAAQSELPNIIRAAWDRLRHRSKLRLLLCGSAVRTMERLGEASAPLYGRFDLFLLLHPFAPAEVSKILPRLSPADRALVWGVVGGTPLYLGWWNQDRSVADNLLDLACRPDGRLFLEGGHILERETFGDLGRQVLFAIGDGRTKHHEIASAIGTDPTRTLERLGQLRLVERMVPVTDDPRRSRRRLYRISDNFLDFWLSCLSRHRTEIERGMGRSIVGTLVNQLNDQMGAPWEEAFRDHLRLMAGRGELGDEVVAIGRFWRDAEGDPATVAGHRPAIEIDAVALAGQSRTPTVVGEAKWARTVDGDKASRALDFKSQWIPGIGTAPLRIVVCAREEVQNPAGVTAITATDIFG